MLELVVRLGLGCLVVVAALLALRWAQARGMTARGGPELRIVGRTGLTKSSLVAVLAVDDRRFLVGAGDGGVRLLSELAPAGELPTSDGDELDARFPEEPGDPPDDMTAAAAAPFEDLDLLDLTGRPAARQHHRTPPGVQRTDAPTHGPRTGPLDRLRAMTVRTHLREPVRAHPPRR